jgi:membrane protease YdiL (CAAX protease family)
MHVIEIYIQKKIVGSPCTTVINACVVTPVLEELLFRKSTLVLLSQVESFFKTLKIPTPAQNSLLRISKYALKLTSATLFASLHNTNTQTAALLGGLFLGELAHKGLLASVIAHAVHNLIFILL